MKAKITDVARQAGVSTTTVSHVINKTRFVSDETTKLVLDAIEVLGYVPNETAKVFKTGKKMMIGCIVPDISNPVFSQLIETVEDIVSKSGYRLLILNTKDSLEKEKNALRSLSSGVVDGLIIASSADNIDVIKDCFPEEFPVVFVDRELGHYDQDSVVLSCYNATIDMLSDLTCSGHEKIGFIVGVPRISTTNERVNAYDDFYRSRGIDYDKNLVKYLERSKDNADTEMDKLIAGECTAIIGTNTSTTLQLLNRIEASEELQRKQITICGFADNSFANRFRNSIPVVEEPVGEMAIRAGEMMLAKIAEPTRVFSIERVPCMYINNKK